MADLLPGPYTLPIAKLEDIQTAGVDLIIAADLILDYLNMHENQGRKGTTVEIPIRHLRRLRQACARATSSAERSPVVTTRE